MNLTLMVGRLTADPEVKYTQDKKTIAKFSLAVNRRFKKEGEADADFFNCVAFGKTAEFIGKYFSKGMKAIVTGELRNNHYTDNNGVKHYSEQIIVNTVEFAESKQTNAQANAQTSNSYEGGFVNVTDDLEEELPFM